MFKEYWCAWCRKKLVAPQDYVVPTINGKHYHPGCDVAARKDFEKGGEQSDPNRMKSANGD